MPCHGTLCKLNLVLPEFFGVQYEGTGAAYMIMTWLSPSYGREYLDISAAYSRLLP